MRLAFDHAAWVALFATVMLRLVWGFPSVHTAVGVCAVLYAAFGLRVDAARYYSLTLPSLRIAVRRCAATYTAVKVGAARPIAVGSDVAFPSCYG